MFTEMKPDATINVRTPYGPQSIVFNDSPALEKTITEYDSVLVVVDERVYKLPKTKQLLATIASVKSMHILAISINNYTKNTTLLTKVIDKMVELGMTRQSLLVSIGGGATSDLTGVAAALYMRGIHYIVVPTSFISMADTVISKVAVNHKDTKNVIGAFRSPVMTYVDIDYCSTINSVDLAHGLVEIFKQSLLEHNEEILDEIAGLLSHDTIDKDALYDLAHWSIKTKIEYIEHDWYDTLGKHKALSLGHTLANYLEMQGEYHHAVAVLYGMVLEFIIAHNRRIITEDQFDEFIHIAMLLERHFKQHEVVKKHLTPTVLLPALRKDKINNNGVLKFVLPTTTSYIITSVSEDELSSAIKAFEILKLNQNAPSVLKLASKNQL